MPESIVGTGRAVGARVRRVEDPRVLLGKSQYVDDIRLDGDLAVAFVRSPYAHAHVKNVAISAALALPGVEAVFDGADLADAIRPLRVEYPADKAPKHKPCNWHVLARGKVRFVGEAVAAVVATDRYTAEDAAGLVEVDYEPLRAASDIEHALRPDAPIIHEEWGDNVMQSVEMEAGPIAQAFQTADCIVSEHFSTGRHMALPMEARGCLAHYEPALGSLTLWSSTQVPHLLRAHLARLLDFPEHYIRVVAPDVGGGFGPKAFLYPEEVLLCHVTRRLGRPVRWIEDRRENLSASLHAKQQAVHAEMALTKDGTILGVRGKFTCDVGAYSAYPWGSALEAGMAASAFPGGPYKVPAFRCEAWTVTTNKTTSGAYRGVGLPVSIFTMERLLDLAAAKLGLDPAELRLRNMIRHEEHPYQVVTGVEIESGSHREALQKALNMLDYAAFRKEQRQARQHGRYLGVGFGCYVESSAYSYRSFEPVGITWGGYESATVRMDANGTVTVIVGTHSHGQSHQTTYAQVAADELGVSVADVRVVEGDTATAPHGWGTWASRSAVLGSGAIIQASGKLREKIIRTASRLCEVPQDDLELTDGRVRRTGNDRTGAVTLMSIRDIAQLLVVKAPAGLPEDEEPGLEATAHYVPPPWTHSNATFLATVEVDVETGQVGLLRLIAVEDCGKMINPIVVDGQIQGGVAQGIGTALYEESAYDENGQLLAGTLMDYLAPTALDVPRVEIGHIETPAPNTPHGIKGMGEGGAISPPAAIANAVADALAPLGVRVTEIPLTPERVLAMIERARPAA